MQDSIRESIWDKLRMYSLDGKVPVCCHQRRCQYGQQAVILDDLPSCIHGSVQPTHDRGPEWLTRVMLPETSGQKWITSGDLAHHKAS